MVVTALQETPLAAVHKSLGARMVDFAGWYMPVRYKSDIQEHQAVRNKVGLFDVSHMGEFLVSGEDAHDFVQYMIANDINRLSKPNMALYTQFVNESGGTVDDLIVYRRENDFLLVVNASNMEKDWNWIQAHAGKFKLLQLKDISNETGLLALQGPMAVKLLSDLVGKDLSGLPSFSYSQEKVDGIEISFGRTGYTGEDGFEIFCAAGDAEKLWKRILEGGEKYGIEPCGLGARDTLRLEAGLPLYGHELDDETGPLEAGLGWSVKLEKGDFIGRDKLKAQKESGLPKQCVCLRSEGKALPRQGYEVWSGSKQVGVVTSGSTGIHVGYPIAFAYVPPELAKEGNQLEIKIRDNMVVAHVVRRPWYKRAK